MTGEDTLWNKESTQVLYNYQYLLQTGTCVCTRKERHKKKTVIKDEIKSFQEKVEKKSLRKVLSE